LIVLKRNTPNLAVMLLRSEVFPRIYICIISFLILLTSCNGDSRSGLNPGDNAPPLELKDLFGKIHKIADYKGKALLINFWATWCGPCVDEIPALQELYSKLGKENFEILAIGVDDQEDALREFQKRYALTFPVLIDKDGAVKNKYKLTGVPESFLLDKEGKLVMLPDPNDNTPVVRIVGPRDWSSPNAIARIRDIINH
jgi:cytochrome c biogenesis protein CcmG/thiol:disulfide interchange protein DsbE